MQLNLIAIGKKMPAWIQTGITHYQKQLPKSLNFNLVTLDAQKINTSNIEKIKTIQSELLLNNTKNANIIIALDENGKLQSSQTIATQMRNWQQNGDNVTLLIGGADGLSTECKQNCQQLWSLSRLTLTHSMARLITIEQIYRAQTIINHHPYHRQ